MNFGKLNIFQKSNKKYFITLSKIIYLIYLYLDLTKNKIIDISSKLFLFIFFK